MPREFASWPRLMRAETAAAYVDEASVQAFRRAVGVLYPRPIAIKGKGERWVRDDLDAAIDTLAGRPGRTPTQTHTQPPADGPIFDAANVLAGGAR